MRHLLSKFSFLSKTLGYLASIVFYGSTFGFCLASYCKKPTRNPGSKTDEHYLKVEFFCYWTCTTFCPNLVFSLKPLATWLPLCFVVQPLASPWLPIVGSQREAQGLKLMNIISKLNFSVTGHAPLSVFF